MELPYKEDGLSMLIILPNDCNGIDTLQNSLKTFDLSTFDSQMLGHDVIVTIPKFTTETSLSLKGPLTAMGMGNVFSNAAELGGLLVGKEGLQVSAVVHKAYINVDENGTVAAAATGVVIRAKTAVFHRVPPIVFTANHPFVYLIKSPSGILFMGRYLM